MLIVVTSQIISVFQYFIKGHHQGTSEPREFHNMWTSLICDPTLIFFISMILQKMENDD